MHEGRQEVVGSGHGVGSESTPAKKYSAEKQRVVLPESPPSLTDDTPSPSMAPGPRSRTLGDHADTDPERRVLFSMDEDSPPAPPASSPPPYQCKGKMPAEYGPSRAVVGGSAGYGSGHTFSALSRFRPHSACAGPAAAGAGPSEVAELVHPQGLTSDDAGAADHMGSGGARRGATNDQVLDISDLSVLHKRRRQLSEAMSDVTKSSHALHDFVACSNKRQGCGGGSCGGSSGCHESKVMQGRSAHMQEEGGVGEVVLQELLETFARAGDERLLSQARSRAAAVALSSCPPSSSAITATTSADSLSHVDDSATPHNAQSPHVAHGSEDMPEEAVFEIIRWRRSLVRRVEGRAEGGESGEGTWGGLVWRVSVTGRCSGLPFDLSFLVNQEMDSVVLETLEVDPSSALELAPFLQHVTTTIPTTTPTITTPTPTSSATTAADAAATNIDTASSNSGREGGGRGGMPGCRGEEGGGGDVQDVMRSLAVYGAVARRRSVVLQDAAERHANTVRATHTHGSDDHSHVRFCRTQRRDSLQAVQTEGRDSLTIDVNWSIRVSSDGTVIEDTEIEPWAPDYMEEEEAATLVSKVKKLWENVLMLKGQASALDVLLSLL